MHRRLLSAAATCALLLGLAACGEPTDGPVTTAPPSISIGAPSDGGGDAEPSDGGGESPEPTAAAPSIPPPDPADYAGMDEHTAEGAEQAFRYYIAMAYWGFQSGDSKEIAALQGSSCTACAELVDEVARVGTQRTFWSETNLADQGTVISDSEYYEYEIGYIYVVGEHQESKAGSDSPIALSAQAFTARGGMNWSEDRWVVEALDIAETDHDL